MAEQINWGLLNSQPNALQYFEVGMKLGGDARKAMTERKQKAALAAYARNPDDREAYATIMQNSPELAIKLSEYGDKRAFGAAMGDYLVPGNAPRGNAAPGHGGAPQGGTNTLGGFAAPPASPAPNALMSAGQPFSPATSLGRPINGASGQPGDFGPGPAGPQAGQPAPAQTAPAAQSSPAQQPDLSILGTPQNGRDHAFLRMVQRDPIKALKIQSTLRNNFVSRVKSEHQLYAFAIDDLSRVGDDAGWQAALQRLAPHAQALGIDLLDHVPGTYPGPDGVRELMEQAQPAKDRLGYLLREGNIDADNARADRNTDSLISERQTRTGIARDRLGETHRNNSQRDRTARRGQDLRPPPRASRARPTATGPKGEKIEFDGKAWVPAK